MSVFVLFFVLNLGLYQLALSVGINCLHWVRWNVWTKFIKQVWVVFLSQWVVCCAVIFISVVLVNCSKSVGLTHWIY